MTAPVFVAPNITKMRAPVMKDTGTTTLNKPTRSAIMLGIMRPNIDAAFRMAI